MAHPDSDDEALSWAGDDDATLAPGWKRVGTPTPASGERVSDAPSTVAPDAAAGDAATAVDQASDETPDQADRTGQTGSVELVVLGILGGVYLLYAVGWLIVATTPAPELADPVATFMYGLGRWFAVLAPALWFGVTLWLCAERHRARLLWLVAGAILFVPIPFLLRG
ncbi:DNA polymerase III subunit gamma/tau [Agromyces sp. NPDC060279]|uniref:DNA polymerase III subunit gamma/tau n=1 Tax=Agromyces sp. NPDC060279 TaxID=3347092 RepID=UPI00364A0C22